MRGTPVRNGAGALIVLLAVGLLAGPAGGVPEEASATSCPSHGAKFEPADGKVLLLVGQERDAMDAYVAGTGVVPGGFMVYSSVAAPLLGTLLPVTLGSGAQHAQHQALSYPDATLQIALHMADQLDVINLGLYDASILLLAQWLQLVDRPVFLRPGYEFDGTHNEHQPEAFVAAWRRIVDQLRSHGVDNVAYVWHSWAHASTYGNHPIAAWYPGDEYVDWVAVSIFSQAYDGGAGLGPAHAVADFAEARGKPLMIAESTPIGAHTPGADAEQLWASWYAPVLDFVSARGVKAWSYINMDWELHGWEGWGDTRVETNPALRARWLAEITQPHFLNASPSLACELGTG